jgi:predicted nucleic acid-binding protein
MPEFVADTSSLQYLHQLGLLDLLPRLYSRVVVPPAVVNELKAGFAGGYDVPQVESYSWIEIREPPNAGISLPAADLGPGERDVLALCIAFPGSTAILDDGLARSHAGTLGIRVTGILGVLIKAKELGYVAEIRPLLDQLTGLGFHLALTTRQFVLRIANEPS